MIVSCVGILVIGYLLLRRSWLDFLLVKACLYKHMNNTAALLISNKVTSFVVPVAGFMYWVIGTSSVQGAEAVVLGWFGYLVISPIFERPVQMKTLIIAIITAFLYPSLFLRLFG